MAFDIFQTHYLLMAVKEITPLTTYFRDTYFPTNDSTDIFATDDVLIEYQDGNKKAAPFVVPRVGGKTILRDGYTMDRYTPPFIAPKRVITIDELKKRGFGESLFPDMTPEQRQQSMILKDLAEMGDMISRREEMMAAETMLTNGCIMKHYGDNDEIVEEKEIRFYKESSNPATYTPTIKWGTTGAKIMDDIYAMSKMLTSRGLPATDLLVSADVQAIILADPTIKELLDLRNMSIGSIAPVSLPNGVSRLGILNIYGRDISIYCYDETYEEDKTGDLKPFIPNGTVILTAPKAGRTLYGAVTQLEQVDREFHTYPARRVPKYIADPIANVRTVTLASCPLMIPNNKNPWITSKVTA